MTLIEDARAFISQLSRNNTRDWFLANKDTYDTRLREPSLALLDRMAPRLQELTGFPTVPKLFRPNRDIRFSKDKTPYKTSLHMLWRIDAGGRQDPVMYFGISMDYVVAGTGMMGFEKTVLADWRKMVDLDGPRIAGIMAEAEAKGFSPRGEPDLKRVPSPFRQDHPQAALLRRKGLALSGDLLASDDLDTALMASFKALWPVADMLIGIAETG